MKITLGIIAIQLAAFSFAQNESLDIAPNTSSNSPAGVKALWDIQLSVNATSETDNSVGMASITFHNNEFWVSKWASDSIFRLSNKGTLISKFIISGVTGTAAITSDGNNLYFSNSSNTISIIDPISQTVAGSITSAASQISRFLTYDPTLDGGNGGFWTGNFSTDIFAISMTGAVLSSIPAATHTLGGMYGTAIDNETAGGPYLWVYHQAGTNNCQLTALDMNTGLPYSMV